MIELLYPFAVWRLTSLLYQEEGPWKIFEGIRKELKRWGVKLSCFWCLSVWVSTPFALLMAKDVPSFIIYWLGLSGIAILINAILDKLEV